ncbi:unnamed protein product [marine sediment metagenome]|uniref:SsrA-binding protein n=1 Tax=marine sediment metagenome TaxID=412755 RepID=X1NRD2_9ZZZZ
MVIKTVATNRKAYHNYLIQDSVEAGIVLTGTEIKSIRDGRVLEKSSRASGPGWKQWLAQRSG